MSTFDPKVFAFDPSLWTGEKPDPSKWYWFDGIGIGPHVDCRSKMSGGCVRSIHSIPSAEEIAALDELERHVRDVIRAAPTAADFDLGGRFDYDCDNIGDMEAKAAAREHQAIAGGLNAALARLDAARKERGQ